MPKKINHGQSKALADDDVVDAPDNQGDIDTAAQPNIKSVKTTANKKEPAKPKGTKDEKKPAKKTRSRANGGGNDKVS